MLPWCNIFLLKCHEWHEKPIQFCSQLEAVNGYIHYVFGQVITGQSPHVAHIDLK